MGWLIDFYLSEEDGAGAGYGDRGFVLPNGKYERSRGNLVHPEWAKIIVEGDERKQGNKLYSEAYARMPEKYKENGYYYFLLALGCIATDNDSAAFGAVIPKNSVLFNRAKRDVEDYNKRNNRDVDYSDVDEKYLEVLNDIWKDLTKEKSPKGR